jgi:hypothetical protein
MAILQTRVFLACLVTSTPALRWELAVAYAKHMDELARVIALHLKVRRWHAISSTWKPSYSSWAALA